MQSSISNRLFVKGPILIVAVLLIHASQGRNNPGMSLPGSEGQVNVSDTPIKKIDSIHLIADSIYYFMQRQDSSKNENFIHLLHEYNNYIRQHGSVSIATYFNYVVPSSFAPAILTEAQQIYYDGTPNSGKNVKVNAKALFTWYNRAVKGKRYGLRVYFGVVGSQFCFILTAVDNTSKECAYYLLDNNYIDPNLPSSGFDRVKAKQAINIYAHHMRYKTDAFDTTNFVISRFYKWGEIYQALTDNMNASDADTSKYYYSFEHGYITPQTNADMYTYGVDGVSSPAGLVGHTCMMCIYHNVQNTYDPNIMYRPGKYTGSYDEIGRPCKPICDVQQISMKEIW